MNPQHVSSGSLPESVEAEAAAWIARLHNTDRTQEDEQSFQRWLAENELHKAAFEGMTDAWDAAGTLKSDVLSRQRLTPLQPGKSDFFSRNARSWARRVAALAAASIVAAIGLIFFHDGGISTGIGERRDMTLADGSRVTLNTDTRIKVQYDDRQRLVKLEHGEAFFDVAKRAGMPFVVKTADSQITALGTSFSVRSEQGKTEVTLVEGKVAVSAERDSLPRQEIRSSSDAIVLSPGQRVILASRKAPKIDRPMVEKVVAWRQGLIALERTPLADAVAEMNRYNPVKLVVTSEIAEAIHVSGIFHAGDSADFAQGLANSHGLKVTHESGRIVLSGR